MPQAIRTLIDEIEILNPLISELESDTTLSLGNSALYGDPSARRSVDFCRCALDGLAAITDDLTVQFNSGKRSRRGIAKVRIVLKKDAWVDYESRLQRVVSMLGLAQQSCLM